MLGWRRSVFSTPPCRAHLLTCKIRFGNLGFCITTGRVLTNKWDCNIKTRNTLSFRFFGDENIGLSEDQDMNTVMLSYDIGSEITHLANGVVSQISYLLLFL